MNNFSLPVRKKILQLFGLATRACALEAGMDAVCGAIAQKRVFVLFLSTDASHRTCRLIESEASKAQIPLYKVATMEAYGSAMGQNPRAVVAMTDQGFAKKCILLLTSNEVNCHEENAYS